MSKLLKQLNQLEQLEIIEKGIETLQYELKETNERSELAESEWRTYLQMSESMSKRIANLLIDNQKLTHLLENLLDDHPNPDRTAWIDADTYLEGKVK